MIAAGDALGAAGAGDGVTVAAGLGVAAGLDVADGVLDDTEVGAVAGVDDPLLHALAKSAAIVRSEAAGALRSRDARVICT